MKKVSLIVIALIASHFILAQDKPAPSPSSKLVQVVGLTEVTVEYSRPGVKDRTIFGDLLEYGKLWRTGANAATKFTFDKDVKIDGKALKAGSYAVLTVPGKNEWKINFYSFDTPGWNSYVDKDPAASTTVKPQKLAEPIETFTIDINNLRDTSATIDLIWQNTKVSVPLTVGTM